jgi:hypothetical protein
MTHDLQKPLYPGLSGNIPPQSPGLIHFDLVDGLLSLSKEPFEHGLSENDLLFREKLRDSIIIELKEISEEIRNSNFYYASFQKLIREILIEIEKNISDINYVLLGLRFTSLGEFLKQSANEFGHPDITGIRLESIVRLGETWLMTFPFWREFVNEAASFSSNRNDALKAQIHIDEISLGLGQHAEFIDSSVTSALQECSLMISEVITSRENRELDLPKSLNQSTLYGVKTVENLTIALLEYDKSLLLEIHNKEFDNEFDRLRYALSTMPALITTALVALASQFFIVMGWLRRFIKN